MVHYFIVGLPFPLYLVSQNIIEIGSSFSQVIDHTIAIQRAYIGTYRGCSQRPCTQYNIISIPSECRDSPDKDQLSLHPISSIKVSSHDIGVSQINHCVHNRKSSSCTLWSIQYRSLDYGISFLHQWVQYAKVLQELILVLLELDTGLYSAPNAIWIFRQG